MIRKRNPFQWEGNVPSIRRLKRDFRTLAWKIQKSHKIVATFRLKKEKGKFVVEDLPGCLLAHLLPPLELTQLVKEGPRLQAILCKKK